MSADAKPKTPFRYWPLVAIGAIALTLFFSNQTAPYTDGGQAITNDAQYQAGLTKVQGLTQAQIVAYDKGQALTADDKAKLREAQGVIDRMNAFLPRIAGLYFLSGKIHHIFGEDQVAEERFLQCTLNAPTDAAANPADAVAIRATAAEAAYQLSLLLLARRDSKGALEQADAAVEAVPQSSLYHTARGSALNELRRTEEAKRELKIALTYDPSNARAASLLRFISHNP